MTFDYFLMMVPDPHRCASSGEEEEEENGNVQPSPQKESKGC